MATLKQMIDNMKLDTSDLINTLLESNDEILKEKATRILELKWKSKFQFAKVNACSAYCLQD